MKANDNVIYLGIKGRVMALDRGTGKRLWETHLKRSGFVNVVVDQGMILAHTSGELFALDPTDGRKLWHDPLTGFGFGHVTMASPTMMVSPQLHSVLAQIQAEEAAAAAASG